MTNEKNFKKMNDGELDVVAGGYRIEMMNDSRFLNVLLQGKSGQCDRYGAWTIGRHQGEVAAAWQAVGVQAEFTSQRGVKNIYKINGQAVTREQAMQHAMNVAGRQLKDSDWQW